MPAFTFRLGDDIAQRFDAQACAHGGRSAYLRRLILDALAEDQSGAGEAIPLLPQRPTQRIEVRLTPSEIRQLDAEAMAIGMKRTDWLRSWLRRRLGSPNAVPHADRAAIAQAWRELNRIGINLNQAVRALNASVMVESGLDTAREAGRVAAFRDDIMTALSGLGKALRGSLAYWDDDDGQ